MPIFKKLPKLKKGDRVAILSPSFAAPGKWPLVYELGLSRLKEIFGLVPVEYPTTRKLGATGEERARDLLAAFRDTAIKAIIASIGGNDQVTYVSKIPDADIIANPKPFFGFSDNTHIANYLWLRGIPSFYGGGLFTQFAMQQGMDDFTVKYLKHAFFDEGEIELETSKTFNEKGLDWNDNSTLTGSRIYEANAGWTWHGAYNSADGRIWGGCLESIDELLRHNHGMPSLEDFEKIVLITETSEEMPPREAVRRTYRALGERGILKNIRGLLVGRPKAWEFDKPLNDADRIKFRADQQSAILEMMEKYNPNIPIVFNLNFGHTDPQISMPYGGRTRILPKNRKIFVTF